MSRGHNFVQDFFLVDLTEEIGQEFNFVYVILASIVLTFLCNGNNVRAASDAIENNSVDEIVQVPPFPGADRINSCPPSVAQMSRQQNMKAASVLSKDSKD